MLTVVGIVDDVMDTGLGADLGPMLYVPYFQQNTPTARISLTIRTKSDPAALANAVRRAIWSIDPVQPIDRVQTLEDALGASSILYKPAAADGAYVVVTVLVLLLCALCATVLPARRAARLSPIDAIRTD